MKDKKFYEAVFNQDLENKEITDENYEKIIQKQENEKDKLQKRILNFTAIGEFIGDLLSGLFR